MDLAAPGTPIYSLAGPGGNRTEVTSVWLICDDVPRRTYDWLAGESGVVSNIFKCLVLHMICALSFRFQCYCRAIM